MTMDKVNGNDVALHYNNGALRGLLHPKTYQETFNAITNNDGVIDLDEIDGLQWSKEAAHRVLTMMVVYSIKK